MCYGLGEKKHLCFMIYWYLSENEYYYYRQKANYYNSYVCKNLPKYISKYCNFAVSTSFRIFLSESSEAAALLPIFPSFDSEQIPGNMMGAAARRPKSSATTTTTTTTIPSSPWPRLFRGRDGTAQQPAAYCVCVWPPLSFSLFCTLDQMRSQMWCGCDLAKMPMMCCLLFFSNVLVKQMMLIALM